MSARRVVLSGLFSTLLIGAVATNAAAATSTATISVTATVSASCNVTGGTLAFGTYDVLSASPTDASLVFTATCATGTSATIGLGLGSHASGTTRRMADADGDLITYELYKESSHTTVWGQSGAATVSYLSTSSAPNNFTVYGRIAPEQNVDTESYSDTVTITITF